MSTTEIQVKLSASSKLKGNEITNVIKEVTSTDKARGKLSNGLSFKKLSKLIVIF